jgi:hypothetical protein
MTEISSFDSLYDRLAARGMKPEKHASESSFIIPGKDRLLNTKFIVASYNSLFFLAYDSYGTNSYSSKTFTGIYGVINLPRETECQIFKKDWIDLIFRRHKCKTDIKFIDKNLTITSVTAWIPSHIIKESDVISFLGLNNRFNPLKIKIEYDFLSLIPELKGKTIIGIETDSWITEDDDLESFIVVGGRLIENFINACD